MPTIMVPDRGGYGTIGTPTTYLWVGHTSQGKNQKPKHV